MKSHQLCWGAAVLAVSLTVFNAAVTVLPGSEAAAISEIVGVAGPVISVLLLGLAIWTTIKQQKSDVKQRS